MKCGNCNFAELVPGTGMQKCTLTEEIHLPADDCNCEDYRVMKYREIDVVNNRENTMSSLEALRARLSGKKPHVDPNYLMSILKSAAKEAGVKVAEAIEYLETFV